MLPDVPFDARARGGASARLLVVDDSADDLRVLTSLLRARNFATVVATDGRQGYERAVSLRPDLILLDVLMPRMDGFAACRLLKADPVTRDVPVIFLTARNDPESRVNGLLLGGVDYVSKPFVEEEVVARVRIHLRLAAGPVAREAGESPVTRPNPDALLIGVATALIRERLADLPDLVQLARLVGTHDKKLNRLFRDHLGMTVMAFVREERLRTARSLLEDTDMTVEDISGLIGFASACNFSTAFRERMGIAPIAYRQRIRGGRATGG